jgi:hypothetical protein
MLPLGADSESAGGVAGLRTDRGNLGALFPTSWAASGTGGRHGKHQMQRGTDSTCRKEAPEIFPHLRGEPQTRVACHGERSGANTWSEGAFGRIVPAARARSSPSPPPIAP